MAEVPLYNSRIIKTYGEYVRKNHPGINMAPLLDYAGIMTYQIEDEGHWLTQSQVDRFHEILVKTTGDPHISRKTGQYTPFSKAAGAVAQYALGLMTPSAAYTFMGKLYPHVSRSITMETRKIGPRQIQAVAIQNPGIKEKPYQCEYRLGAFEGTAKLFTKKLATIEHTTCMHRSGDRCIYEISWEEPPSLSWKRISRYSDLVGLIVGASLLFALPVQYSAVAIPCLLLAVMAVSLHQTRLEKDELTAAFKHHSDLAGDLLEEVNARYNNAMLVQEIGQAFSSILDFDRLLQFTVEAMEKRLDFNRGMIMLASGDRTRLVYRVGYGYDGEAFALLNNTSFHLDKPGTTAPFIACFREQRPFLINDLKEIEKNISARSRGLAERMGVKSFVCVPIVYEGIAEGILAMDTPRSDRPLNQSDVSLLSGIAHQIGISIHNAKTYQLIQQNEQRFRALIQNSSDVISILDEQGRFIYNTPSAQTVFGYPSEDLAGKSSFTWIHPDDLELVRGAYAKVVKRTNQGFPTEYRFRKGDGTWITLESLGSNFLDYPGINGIVVTSRDITERKRIEEEHQALEERLKRSEKMEALGTLAGGVAHDLNNILGVLVGYSELLLEKTPEGGPSRRYADKILQSGLKGAAIIQDLLTLARRGVAVSEVVNLNLIVSEYLGSPELESLKCYHPLVSLETDLGRDLLNIHGSPVHLGKTVMNLVSNAAEAISNGGRVTIRTENRYLDKPIPGYDGMKEGDYVVLSVTDTGKGISPADIGKIFEPFYTKKVMGRSGTGLGLAVVWGTVKDHSGYIDVKSREEEGSTFTLYFPVTRKELSPEQEAVLPDTYMGHGESILVVDDLKEQRELALSMLIRLGYRVSTVSSGEEALDFVKANRADLIVLDMIMDPGIDGLETYRRIIEINPGQKVVIVSGFSETERVKKAQELGAGAYVRKPYILKTIGAAIRNELD